MLPKNRRIERKEFPTIITSGKRLNSDSFLLYISPLKETNSKSPSKIAFSASKKVEKLAVKRNKLRRWGYSIIRKHLKHVKDGFYMFFVYKKDYNKQSEGLEKEILGLLS